MCRMYFLTHHVQNSFPGSRCVCSPGEFQCPGGDCVPAHRVCDGRRDCASGTDEAVCPSKGVKLKFKIFSSMNVFPSKAVPCGLTNFLRVTVTCAPDQFACRDWTCVSNTKLCDGTPDCLGGEDETRNNCRTFIVTPAPPPVTLPGQTSQIQAPIPCFSGSTNLNLQPLF